MTHYFHNYSLTINHHQPLYQPLDQPPYQPLLATISIIINHIIHHSSPLLSHAKLDPRDPPPLGKDCASIRTSDRTSLVPGRWTWRHRKATGKPGENRGKTVGKPWENQKNGGKTVGKRWENHGLRCKKKPLDTWKYTKMCDTRWVFILEYIIHRNIGKTAAFTGKNTEKLRENHQKHPHTCKIYPTHIKTRSI